MCIWEELTIVSHNIDDDGDDDSTSNNRNVDIERIELFFFLELRERRCE